jgi:4-diphosphocytidyl-2-C-methyl-D-erythritol kinase
MTAPMARTVSVRAPGKVNAGLAVGALRADGYHTLETLLVAVSCYEEVMITRAPSLKITVSGASGSQVPTDKSNLAAQAAALLAQRCGIDPAVHIHIKKRIPLCGGMAGGSADAAATLVGCDAMWNARLGLSELMALAAKLGADVPFSLLGGAAIGRGRGDVLEPVGHVKPYHWVFATADAGLSTPAMFASWDETREGTQALSASAALPTDLLRAFASGDARWLADELVNDFEPLALDLRPSLLETREAGLRAGALAGILAGTGATYAFLADSAAGARIVAGKLTASGVCAGAIVTQGPVAGPSIMTVE